MGNKRIYEYSKDDPISLTELIDVLGKNNIQI